LEDYVSDDNPACVIEAFIDELDLKALGFEGAVPEITGRPGYHPAALLKNYLYGYLNRIPSSRRLERETQRNAELMWLTGRLMRDFKTIADFPSEAIPRTTLIRRPARTGAGGKIEPNLFQGRPKPGIANTDSRECCDLSPDLRDGHACYFSSV
jgi:Transposase domain (DUF772)